MKIREFAMKLGLSTPTIVNRCDSYGILGLLLVGQQRPSRDLQVELELKNFHLNAQLHVAFVTENSKAEAPMITLLSTKQNVV